MVTSSLLFLLLGDTTFCHRVEAELSNYLNHNREWGYPTDDYSEMGVSEKDLQPLTLTAPILEREERYLADTIINFPCFTDFLLISIFYLSQVYL